jgi:hypothetical protein
MNQPSLFLATVTLCATATFACGGDSGSKNENVAGASDGTGGASDNTASHTATFGGNTSHQSTNISRGGSTHLGIATHTGGSMNTGGSVNLGGTSSKGGASNSGGSANTGGTSSKGGTSNSGGSTNTGGTSSKAQTGTNSVDMSKLPPASDFAKICTAYRDYQIKVATDCPSGFEKSLTTLFDLTCTVYDSSLSTDCKRIAAGDYQCNMDNNQKVQCLTGGSVPIGSSPAACDALSQAYMNCQQ